MTRILMVSGVVGLLALAPSNASAQYGYPSGYGGYGWGGWGSTPQGSIARGLGYFNTGRGAYNENTAVARSINTDTVIRWNQYGYLSQQEANSRYGAHLRARRNRINRARAEIQDRLRSHPTTRDITDGDALNVTLDVLLNPALAGSSLWRIKTPVGPDVIAEIPFAFASEGVTICLDRMTMEEQWPLALRVERFRPEREGLRKAIQVALEEDKEGDLEPKTIEDVQAAMDRLRVKFQELVSQTNPDYIPAHDTIKAMAGLTKMLYSPQVEEILAELQKYRGTTLGELLSFMQAFNLRFAHANSFRQRQLYMKLYPMLAEQANGPLGDAAGNVAEAAAKSVQNTGEEAARAAEGAGAQARGAAGSPGTKAVDGLKSAAVDFFRDMDWKHLSGPAKAPAAQP
jgi:hypothetical protein